ncbi:hypothetical protein [Capillimicrobium parvum]|uniref:Uncharacterized protein n=1 Tax=Capillimicrobium parvum TaxID=2884022 RepID=A0A9E6Y279_9ACTN|nr:hypothetical protein [Capillimicrobium parvum]UGS38508.1 hypothetical protein DSM104329_04937 [Capillimicrobium parvum]
MAIYTMVQDELHAAYLGADLARLDGLPDADLAQEISARLDAAVSRNVDPHDDPSYLRAVLVQNGRNAFRAGRLVPLRIKPFAI